MIQNYEDAINYIHGRHKWKKTLSFHRIEALLAALGNPQLKSKYVHITGTNGKGSTSKMTAQLLRAAGLKVGLFTSPFIMRFNERIQDDNGDIPDDILTDIMKRIEPITERLDAEMPEGGPTEFETLTALMFVYFAEHPVDVVVLEVGVGGTWDTTNIVPNKLASVITTVGLDHMAVLGDTIEKIATQKAGIIMADAPVIIGDLPAEAEKVIRQRAATMQVPVLAYNEDFTVEPTAAETTWGETFNYHGMTDFQGVYLDLMGTYQLENAGVAITTALVTLQLMQKELTSEMVHHALASVQWPARFEKLSDKPLTIIDGAHNEPGVEALAKTITASLADRHVTILFGALTDKAYADMLQTLADLPNVQVDVVGFQPPTMRTRIDPTEAASQVVGHDVKHHENWQIAYETLKHTVPEDEVIIFTGSLYFVSEVRQGMLG